MAKKTVKTKAKTKSKTKAKVKAKPQAKPQAVKTVVKKESVGKVINKPSPSVTTNKEKAASKILLIASLVLVVVAFCVTFAPAFNLQYFDKSDVLLGTGTISSLFTVMFCFIRSSYTCNVIATGAPLEGSIKAIGKKYVPFAITMAAVITLLVLVAIVVLVLFLTKKYRGKVKLAFSITSWVLLLAIVSLMFLSSVLIPSVRVPKWTESTSVDIALAATSLGIAPILCGSFGALALCSSVTSFALNHK